MAAACERGFRLCRQGAPQDGTILLFGQVHMRPELADDWEVQQEVLQSQQGILDDLLILKPERVFTEGLSRKLSAKEVAASDAYHTVLHEIAEHFGDYQIGQPLSYKQQELLLDEHGGGGAEVYLFLCCIKQRDMSLLPTTTAEDNARLNEEVERQRKQGRVDRSLLFGERDERAIKMVVQSLQDTPGVVALVFGMNHVSFSFLSKACEDQSHETGFSPRIFYKNYAPGSEEYRRDCDERLSRLLCTISNTVSLEDYLVSVIVRSASLLPDFECQQVFEALHDRAKATSDEIERTVIEDALRSWADERRLIQPAFLPRILYAPGSSERKERDDDKRLSRLLDIISNADSLEDYGVSIIVESASRLSDVACQQISEALYDRATSTSNAIERTLINDALRSLRRLKRGLIQPAIK